MKQLWHVFTLGFLLMYTAAPGGSFFSSRSGDVGLRIYTVGVRGLGMGGTGLASRDSLALNFQLVSQWRHIRETRAIIGMQYRRIVTETAGANFTTSTAGFDGAGFAIPIKKGQWVFGMALQPYTNLDFRAIQQISTEEVEYEQVNRLEGSITKAHLSLVWSPGPAVGIGLSANYYLGTINDRFDLLFTSTSYTDITHITQYSLTGPGVGVSVDLQPTQWWMLAGFIDFPPSIAITVRRQTNARLPEIQERAFRTFPTQFGVGTSLKMSSRWILAADYSYQYWSSVFKTSRPDVEDWYHLGLGFERSATRKRHVSLFNHIDVRGGVSLTRLGYRFNDHSVFEYGLHFGLGIPFGTFRNRLDMAVTGGVRGNLSKNLAKETFVRIHLAISMGELWFQKIR
ncbi:MAG: hypothetical protein D6681_16685 [Calditrichaeota bacterium]|nr:MAG: hypothetical protein D6681_16685 [Calditrichota bacterium]